MEEASSNCVNLVGFVPFTVSTAYENFTPSVVNRALTYSFPSFDP
nr:MAG TPA: hypothetical protein [Caudoviricetes sp.]